ncbi:MAG: carboxypeptidase-like regulatory domain-containing protein [Acidobacteriota bacterium]|nr:carboxypeptidase-like regulatory domain-containing protein [Acidobacteriota bacterium]
MFTSLSLTASTTAQDTVTGAFEGTVTSSDTGEAVAGAAVQIINGATGQVFPKTSDSRGRFYQGLLHPGIYTIRVSAPGFQTKEVIQRLFITKTGEVIPVPVSLDPAPPGATPTPPIAGATPLAAASPTTPNVITEADTDIRARINASDARQGGSFTEEEVSTLPLGSSTLTRTFDELTLLLPGVAPPPQTLGSVAGPGVGAGVGSAGQFAVNGLRSRANNFTVDGSDNNDEDIGVRRQGFVALIPQPIESIKEYQAITLLAPAQFGRNIGAQVNAVSKSGGSETHGTFYGFINSSQLNARNFFDTTFGNAVTPLRVGNQAVVVTDRINPFFFTPDLTRARPITVQNFSGGEDSFTLGQGGFVLGGPLEPARGPDQPGRMFYFISAEGYIQNAAQEESFAVPTVAQRGVFGSGATGLFFDPTGQNFPTFTLPTTAGADAVFSLFPFPNNPNGVYGPNTFTQVLPNSGQGKVLSGKFDANFKLFDRQHSLTNRYNFTDDYRIIPVTGGALFSSLRPRIRTQNNSFFFNSELTDPNSSRPVFNQIRLSYGRTRLVFEEERDRTFQLENTLLPGTPFLLNAPVLENFTSPALLPNGTFGPNTGPVVYFTDPSLTVQNAMTLGSLGQMTRLGAIGQVNIAGFSPVGVDVFNFPQRRVNNTYQIADELTFRTSRHTYVFGVDTRRTELNSELPRNSRPLLTFSGAPEILLRPAAQGSGFDVFLSGNFVRPETLAAASAPSGFFQTLAMRGESATNLLFYQLNFYGQDTWRLRPNISLSYGLRYEYNTPPSETSDRIESTFDDPALNLVPGIRDFIGDRTRIFEPDRNNFAPRVGIAYAPNFFGPERATVIRAGYGLFYDQILGAVVSQSRNVYPTYLTVNFAGGISNLAFIQGGVPNGLFCPPAGCPLQIFNPSNLIPDLSGGIRSGVRLVQPGTLNTVNPNLSFTEAVNLINGIVRGGGGFIPPTSGFGFTIPEQNLETPLAHHFGVTVDQQLGQNLTLAVSYIGTRGRKLLRFNTPNLGPNSYIAVSGLNFIPSTGAVGPANLEFFGLTLPPGVRVDNAGNLIVTGRPAPNAGAVFRYESTASSDYNALQVQVRSRLRRTLQMQASYTFAKAEDDVSDVFDLAGASSLPQNSLNLDAERGPANFDVRHRFAYNFIYSLPTFTERGAAFRALFGGFQVAGLGSFQTGQPFTVNSIFDVNLDGNLTDRLDSTNGITHTGDRRQPLRLTTDDPTGLLASIGEDGSVGRNSFRAGNFLEIDLAVIKNFRVSENQNFIFRMDVFNATNRDNFGIPVRYLEAPGFGQATNTVTPGRRIQFALKYSF